MSGSWPVHRIVKTSWSSRHDIKYRIEKSRGCSKLQGQDKSFLFPSFLFYVEWMNLLDREIQKKKKRGGESRVCRQQVTAQLRLWPFLLWLSTARDRVWHLFDPTNPRPCLKCVLCVCMSGGSGWTRYNLSFPTTSTSLRVHVLRSLLLVYRKEVQDYPSILPLLPVSSTPVITTTHSHIHVNISSGSCYCCCRTANSFFLSRFTTWIPTAVSVQWPHMASSTTSCSSD